MNKAANDNEELSFITLQAATRNVTRYLKLEEPTPSEKREFGNRPSQHDGPIPVRIFSGLPVKDEGSDQLKDQKTADDPLRDTHRSAPSHRQNDDSKKRQTGRKRSDEEKRRDHAEAVNQRLRELAAFERRLDRIRNQN